MDGIPVRSISIEVIDGAAQTAQYDVLAGCRAARDSASVSASSAAVARQVAESAADDALAAVASVPSVGSGSTQISTNAANDAKYTPIAHASSTSNPHSVTAAQVGLGSVTNVAQLPASYLDTDTTLAANSDAKVPSQKAVKAYVDGRTATSGLTPVQAMFWAY